MPARFVQRRVTELAEAVLGRIGEAQNSPQLADLDSGAFARYSALIRSRAERLARSGVAR